MTGTENIMAVQMTTAPASSDAAPVAGPARFGLAGKIVGWLLMVAAGLVVLALLAVTLGPRFLPYQALIVRSGSMSPTIPTGSIVFYRKIAADKVKVGDVIVFTKPDQPNEKVTHRVVQIGRSATGPYYVTKGDANGTPDDWRVPAVGTGWIAWFHVPTAGYALAYMQSTLARLLLLVIPAILLGAITLYEIWHDRARGAQA
jgi:signal peptidase